MRSTYTLTAAAITALASAQTFTGCDPTKKTCPNNPALPATFITDFKAGKSAVKGWTQTAGSLNYVAAGAEFTVKSKGDAPTIQTDGYLHFGYVEVKMKAAPGAGIISSIVLESDDLDEVDWEFVGSVGNKAQMNYFGKGNTTTYDRMIPADVSDAQALHTYALNWTADALTWLIDDKPQRTLKFGDANGGATYPQTPSNVRIGIWAGGDSDNQGTRDWAGGRPDYSKAPFTQLVDSVKIINYSPGKEYQWTDQTGSYKSIKVIEPGNKDGSSVNSVAIQPSATASGKPIDSAINKPTATGVAPASTKTGPGGSYFPGKPTGKPTGTGNYPGPFPHPTGHFGNHTKPSNGSFCGVVTVTVTGYPPSSTPVKITTSSPAVKPSTPAASTPAKSSAPVSAPPASTKAATPTGGIAVDTKSPPPAVFPTAPTGAVPSPSKPANSSVPVAFPGAAPHVGATMGSLMSVAGAVIIGMLVL